MPVKLLGRCENNVNSPPLIRDSKEESERERRETNDHHDRLVLYFSTICSRA